MGELRELEKFGNMNKLITCASLAAVGATSLHAQFTGNDSGQKPWFMSARLRGFYDDNYTTGGSGAGQIPKRSSWGMMASPSLGYNAQWDVTTLSLSYEYDAFYYADRDASKQPGAIGSTDPIDSSHQAKVGFSHSFSEQFKLDLSDSFVVAQEPTVIDPTIQTAYLRTQGDNIRNTANAALTMGLTKSLSSVVSYSNTLKDYKESGDGSRSALLDGMDQLISVDGRWSFSESTTGVVGYQFEDYDYSSKYRLFPTVGPGYALTPAQAALIPTSKSRDQRSHFLMGGVDESLTAKLSGQVRVGAQYTEFYNLPNSPTKWSPYADANVSYQFGEGSTARVGVRHARNGTDVGFESILSALAGAETLDQESTTLWGSLSHRITPLLTATLRGQWQNGRFEGGSADGQYDNYYSGEVNFSYKLPQCWKFLTTFVEAGYSYDRLDSDLINRSFTRNRGYLGLKADL